jgi:hypothetical protein
VNVVVASPLVRREIGAGELGAFMGGKGFPAYWKEVCSALEQHHYIVCYKGSALATTRRPSRLLARFDVSRQGRTLQVAAGESPQLTVRVTNIGDTVWLATALLGEGWTRLGVHLYKHGDDRQLLDFDWHRQNLPADVEPGQQLRVRVHMPAILTPGSYVAVFDLVVEGVCWFAGRGSRTGSARISVQ